MTLEDRERLARCQLSEMTALFPGYGYAELRELRHGHQKAIAQRAYRKRNTNCGAEPTSDFSEQRMREDARQGSERLLEALLRIAA